MSFSEKLKVVAFYTGFWIIFTIAFAVMFIMLAACVVGIPFGILVTVLGLAVMLFDADFVLTQLAPQIMLFGGLAAALFAAFLGAAAVKLGFVVSRLFLRIRRRCDALRKW